MKKTHCKHGHLRIPENLYAHGACKICAKERTKRWRKENSDGYVSAQEYCKRGHLRTPDNVYPANGECKICANMRQYEKRHSDLNLFNAKARERYAKNPEIRLITNNAWKERNPEKVKEIKRTDYFNNKDYYLQKKRDWCRNNPDKCRDIARRKYLKYPEKARARVMKRRAAKIQRTPKWLTKEQLWDMELQYLLSKALTDETGVPHHVDHIVPLRGENVSGLHVPWNLQVLPARENQSKGNRFYA